MPPERLPDVAAPKPPCAGGRSGWGWPLHRAAVRSSGITLVEILVVVAITLVLASLMFPSLQSVINKGKYIICLSHLKRLHSTFSSMVVDGAPWPHPPASLPVGSKDEQKWWLEYSSNNLHLGQDVWRCPLITSLSGGSKSSNCPTIHYLPTLFDSKPGTAYQWPNMPWFSEISNVHGKGNLLVYPDGSVRTSQ